ncbi:MAG: hypothetical protein ChlgKO_07260 [Chlamydiales bacterium]
MRSIQSRDRENKFFNTFEPKVVQLVPESRKKMDGLFQEESIGGALSRLNLHQQVEMLIRIEESNSFCILDRPIESIYLQDPIAAEIARVQSKIVEIVNGKTQKAMSKPFGGAMDDCNAAIWVLEHTDEISDKQALLKLATTAKWEQTANLLR